MEASRMTDLPGAMRKSVLKALRGNYDGCCGLIDCDFCNYNGFRHGDKHADSLPAEVRKGEIPERRERADILRTSTVSSAVSAISLPPLPFPLPPLKAGMFDDPPSDVVTLPINTSASFLDMPDVSSWFFNNDNGQTLSGILESDLKSEQTDNEPSEPSSRSLYSLSEYSALDTVVMASNLSGRSLKLRTDITCLPQQSRPKCSWEVIDEAVVLMQDESYSDCDDLGFPTARSTSSTERLIRATATLEHEKLEYFERLPLTQRMVACLASSRFLVGQKQKRTRRQPAFGRHQCSDVSMKLSEMALTNLSKPERVLGVIELSGEFLDVETLLRLGPLRQPHCGMARKKHTDTRNNL
ncbi:hypothetical protein BC832DRAFT_561005 [Gaertneriomyces semiglobifer]|nr:hypothetical protein BC832DRAFT_561005 [Gaertneriomyces semiglobifer]